MLKVPSPSGLQHRPLDLVQQVAHRLGGLGGIGEAAATARPRFTPSSRPTVSRTQSSSVNERRRQNRTWYGFSMPSGWSSPAFTRRTARAAACAQQTVHHGRRQDRRR